MADTDLTTSQDLVPDAEKALVPPVPTARELATTGEAPMTGIPGRARAERIRTIVVYVLLFAIALLYFVPFVWMVSTSFKTLPETAYFKLLPEHPTFAAYREALTTFHFARYAVNSIGLAAVVTGLNVFFCSLGGFDTHSAQLPTQQTLFSQLDPALTAFYNSTAELAVQQQVTSFTLSDFSRTYQPGSNGGTDHGAAAPMFIIGNKVRAGLLGSYPSLAPQDLFQGDIKFNVDFRSVYAGVLEEWLKTKSAPILGRQFTPLPVV